MADNLWLEDGDSSRPTNSRRHRLGILVAVATCLLVVGVPVALVVSGSSDQRSTEAKASHPARGGHSQAARQVLSALSATTSSGDFDVSYTFGGQQGGPPSTSPTTTCSVSGSGGMGGVCTGGDPANDQPVNGTATIDVRPFAMVATSDVSGFGSIVLRDNGTDVWEEGGGDYGLSPGSGDSGPGSSLSGFASLVEGTLGPRQGALAMMGLASPTGYLDLDQAETGNADLAGTDTVDGVPVDIYQISMTPAEGGQVPGLTPQEQQATSDALHVLSKQGYTGSTVRISIDAAGFIRRTQTTDHFADGATMTSEAEFSNFGCVGTVLMPGQLGSTTPPAGCTSTDNPTATTGPAAGSTSTSSTSTTPPSTSSPTAAPSSGTTSIINSTPPSSSTSLPSGPTSTFPSSSPSTT